MSQCNIKEMGYVDRDWEHYEFQMLTETRLKCKDALINQLREQLRSISQRLKSGHTVWIDYDDGSRIYLKGYTTEPPQKEPLGPYPASSPRVCDLPKPERDE